MLCCLWLFSKLPSSEREHFLGSLVAVAAGVLLVSCSTIASTTHQDGVDSCSMILLHCVSWYMWCLLGVSKVGRAVVGKPSLPVHLKDGSSHGILFASKRCLSAP